MIIEEEEEEEELEGGNLTSPAKPATRDTGEARFVLQKQRPTFVRARDVATRGRGTSGIKDLTAALGYRG